MKQYCRYCCYLVCGDTNYCTEQKRTMSDAAAKSDEFISGGRE